MIALHKKFFIMGCIITQGIFAYTQREDLLINHVKKSIALAEKRISKLTPGVLAVEGMTSPKIKHLLNNLCTLPQTSYLEIGVWKGATFTAALYANHDSIQQAVGIDNWSERGGPEAEFKNNCCTFIANVSYQFYTHDSFTIHKDGLFNAPVDIYFYDGNHSEEAQMKAFTYYDSLFAPTFIAIVDDWNHEPARIGTKKSFEKLGYTVVFERELPGYHNEIEWWNGLYIAVVTKK